MSSPRVIGLILAGGRSQRMGQDKAFVSLAGRPLIEHVIARLAPQVDTLVISSNAPRENFAAFHLPVLADIHGGFRGPLAGVHAVLVTYPDDIVISVAVDLPLLPLDLVEQLKQSWEGTRCRYAAAHDSRDDARDGGGTTPRMEEVEPRREQRPRATPGAVAGTAVEGHTEHALAILWPPRRAAALEHYLRTAASVSGWLAAQGEPVRFPPASAVALDANLNTPADLARIEALLAHPAR